MVPPRLPLEIVLEFISAKGESRKFAWEEEQYRFRVNGTGASVRVPWQEPWLRPALEKDLAKPEPGGEVIEQLGRFLGDFLLPTRWAQHRDELEKALGSGQPVHLTLRMENADELFSLPWELLPMGSKNKIAGLEDCLLQYESVSPSKSTRQATPKGRILFAYAMGGRSGPAKAHLDALRTACKEIEFDPQEDVLHLTSRETLVRKLEEKERPVTVLHVLCHGGKVGQGAYGLVLDPVDSSGRQDVISAPELRDLIFSQPRPFLRLVTLCSCQGGDAGTPANLLGGVARMFHEQQVPAVIASRLPLSVEGSIILTETLYEELLGEAGNLRTAVSAVRKRLKATSIGRDWLSLQVYARAGDQAALYPFGAPPPLAPAPASALRELVLIRHEAYKRVTEEPDPSSFPDLFQGRQPRRVEIDQTLTLEGRQWKNLEEEVQRLASPEGALRTALAERNTEVVYYGFPYVPLAVLAGYLAKKRRVQLLECVDDRFAWASPTNGPFAPLRVEADRREAGSVARLRVSVSAPVKLEDCQQVLPEQDVKLDLHFRLEKQERNSVRWEDQLQAYVRVIREALNQYVLNDTSRFESIHLFAAVPVSLAFHLGRELSGTSWLPRCCVYNFGFGESPRYKWRLCLDDAFVGKQAVEILHSDS